MTGEHGLRRALIAAPLSTVGALAVTLLGLILVLAFLVGDLALAVLGIVFFAAGPGLLLVIVGLPTAFVLTGALVGLARVTGTSLHTVSFRTVVIAAVLGCLLASLGLLWLVDNLAEWWMSLFAAPAGLVGARTFVRLRSRAAAT